MRKFNLFLFLTILLTTFTFNLQAQHPLNNGLELIEDYYEYIPRISAVIDSPYVYTECGYGILLEKIVRIDSNTLELVKLDTLRGYGYSKDVSMIARNGKVAWSSKDFNLFNVAEMVDESLVMRHQSYGEFSTQLISFCEDTLLLTSDGFLDISDLENPEWIWQSQFPNQTRFSVKDGDQLFTYLWLKIYSWDVSDIRNPVILDSISFEVGPTIHNGTLPVKVGNKLFVSLQDHVLVGEVNADGIVSETYDWYLADEIPQSSGVIHWSSAINDTLVLVYSQRTNQFQDTYYAILDPDESFEDLTVYTRQLEVNSGISHFIDEAREYFTASDQFFYSNGHGRYDFIYDFSDFRNPDCDYTCTPLKTSFGLVLGYDQHRNTFLSNTLIAGELRFLYNELLSDGNPITLAEIPFNDEYILTDSDILDSIIAAKFRINGAEPDSGFLYSYSDEDSLQLLYRLPPSDNNKLFKKENFYYLISKVEDEVIEISFLDGNEANYLDTYDLEYFIYEIAVDGDNLVFYTTPYVYLFTPDRYGNLTPCDTLESQIAGSPHQPALDNSYFGYRNKLYHINENQEFEFIHEYEVSPNCDYFNNLDWHIYDIEYPYLFLKWKNFKNESLLSVFDISQSCSDTVATIFEISLPGPLMVKGDTIYVDQYFSFSSFRITNDFNGVDVDKAGFAELPLDFQLLAPYPNPFNSYVKIPFQLNRTGNVSVTVYDILGREITRFTNKRYSAGNHSLLWQGMSQSNTPVSSGTYFINLKTDNRSSTRKIVLVK